MTEPSNGTHANAEFDRESHKRPSRTNTSAVPLAEEEIESHQVLSPPSYASVSEHSEGFSCDGATHLTEGYHLPVFAQRSA